MDTIVTCIEPLNDNFWEAELNHQNFYDNNPKNGYAKNSVTKKIKIVENMKEYDPYYEPVKN